MWLYGGSDFRSARAGATETHLFIFSVAYKGISFLISCLTHFLYMWHRNPLKRHFEIELENKSCTNACVLFFSLVGTLLDTLWGVFARLLGVSALKKTRFSQAWGPRLAKSGVSPCLGPLVLQKYCVFLSRAPRATQKTTIQHACPWLGAPGQPKKGPSSLTLNLDQQPDKLKSTEKQKTDLLHWVTLRGGLGAAH